MGTALRTNLGRVLDAADRDDFAASPRDVTLRRFWCRGPARANPGPALHGGPAKVFDLAERRAAPGRIRP